MNIEPSAPVQQSVREAEAVKERDKLGYTVCQVIAAIESLVAGAEEYEGDDGFLHQGAPIDLWSALNDALDDMLPRAEEFEAKYQALSTSPLLDKNDQTEGKEIFAWAEFDGEGGYDLRLYEDNEEYRDEYIARNGEKYSDWVMPLYTHPKPPQPDSNELVEALKLAKDTINVLWVSHHANRADAAISAIDAALAQSPSVGLNMKKGG